MSIFEEAKKRRKFVAHDLIIENWDSIKSYFQNLESRNISTVKELEEWMQNRTELESVLEEEMAWRYIKMNCDTANADLQKHFNVFVSEIEPNIAPFSNVLDKKLLQSPALPALDQKKYYTLIRALKKRESLFRQENVSIMAQLQTMEQEFGTVNSQMTVEVDGKTLTLQQAAVFLKDTNRETRKTVYFQIQNRRLQDEDALNTLLTKLIEKRHQIALNAGFENYRDFKFQDLGRFDYTKDDCFNFHQSILNTVPKINAQFLEKRKKSLQYQDLFPWDLDVDSQNKPALKPFKDSQELIEKTINCFTEIRPLYASFIKKMADEGYMDLESRIGKAPGGFNYPLYESNIPFIYMNAAGVLHDVETMVHEGGHAIHSCLTAHLPLVEFKSLPSEVAELASMSMELISMEHWHHFFTDTYDLKRAKQSQLEGIISILQWVAIVDEFQHILYENPNHSVEERQEFWLDIINKYDTGIVNWTETHKFRRAQWQKQLHIFEVPFYYIEYGIAQLGAIAMWRQYLTNKEKALDNYENFLKLGYTKPIPEIYKAAGIEFNFSQKYVSELMEFVQNQLALL